MTRFSFGEYCGGEGGGGLGADGWGAWSRGGGVRSTSIGDPRPLERGLSTIMGEGDRESIFMGVNT